MITFLSKLGSVLAKGLALATGVWPLVSTSFGASAKTNQIATTAINDLTAVGGVVVQAEALLGPGSGQDKLTAATPLVANIVKTSEMLSGHKIAKEDLFVQGCTELTSAVAKILNSLSPDTVHTASGQQPVVVSNSVAQQTAAK